MLLSCNLRQEKGWEFAQVQVLRAKDDNSSLKCTMEVDFPQLT
jgi:hypothetical protein